MTTRPEPDPTSTPTPSTAATELEITVDQGDGRSVTYTLTCDPPGGDHPDPEGACAALAALPEPFAPVPAGMMCTQEYGGPQTATVRGTYRSEPVEAVLTRTDGCEISRWQSHVVVLGERGAATGS